MASQGNVIEPLRKRCAALRRLRGWVVVQTVCPAVLLLLLVLLAASPVPIALVGFGVVGGLWEIASLTRRLRREHD